MLRSNRGLSCTVSKIYQDTGRKFVNFSTHVYLTLPPTGLTLELYNDAWAQKKLDMMPGDLADENSFMIFLAVWVQYTIVTGMQTDGHRPTYSAYAERRAVNRYKIGDDDDNDDGDDDDD